jgi:hypothetical protein
MELPYLFVVQANLLADVAFEYLLHRCDVNCI